jgi:NAD dependent epimerase/dehydratase family
VTADRDAEDEAGTFGGRVAALRPDVVIDLICFTAASARQLTDALRPSRPLLIHCGTIWVHGPALRVPVTEDEPRTAYGEYGTGKAEIEALLHRETLAGGVPAVVLHPGHISGPGWPVITPAGNLDPAVWTRLATGRPLALPDNGLGVLHHVHADDVAQAFERAMSRPAAIGASFHVVAEQAMTLRGLAAGVAGWFGREPVLEFTDWATALAEAGFLGVSLDAVGHGDRRLADFDVIFDPGRWDAEFEATETGRTARTITRTASSRPRSCPSPPSWTSTCPPGRSGTFTPRSGRGTRASPAGSSTSSTRAWGISSRPS